MVDFKGIKISYQSENSTSTWESPYFDAGFEDILEGFYGLCVSQGWHPVTVISGMMEFAKDRDSILDNDN